MSSYTSCSALSVMSIPLLCTVSMLLTFYITNKSISVTYCLRCLMVYPYLSNHWLRLCGYDNLSINRLYTSKTTNSNILIMLKVPCKVVVRAKKLCWFSASWVLPFTSSGQEHSLKSFLFQSWKWPLLLAFHDIITLTSDSKFLVEAALCLR